MNEAALEKIAQWEATVEEKNVLIEQERELRAEILEGAYAYNPAELVTGTKRIKLPTGQDLKAVFKVTVSVDAKQAPDILSQLVADGMSPEMANKVFKWTPKLNAAIYKELTPERKAIVDQALTHKSGVPSLSVESSKGK